MQRKEKRRMTTQRNERGSLCRASFLWAALASTRQFSGRSLQLGSDLEVADKDDEENSVTRQRKSKTYKTTEG